MKKISILLSVILSMTFSIYAKFAGGSGTENDPYLIKTVQNLDNIRHHMGESVHFRLGNDLIVDNDFQQIEEFRGTFDGNEYLLYVRNSFVRKNFGTIKNLGVMITYLGSEHTEIHYDEVGVGGIAGWNAGTIFRCFVYGSFTNTQNVEIGGIAGYHVGGGIIKDCKAYAYINGTAGAYGGIFGWGGGPVEGCYFHGTIIGNNFIGGIGGMGGYKSDFINCHAYAMLQVRNSGVGGIAAIAFQEITTSIGLIGRIDNCYAHGVVKGKSTVGGLIGVGNNYYYDGLSYSAVIVDNREATKESFGVLIGDGGRYSNNNRGTFWADTEINQGYVGNIMVGDNNGITGSIPHQFTISEMFSLNIGSPYAHSTSPGYPEFEKDPEIERWRGFDDVESFLNHLNPTLMDKLVNWECFGLSSYTPWSEVVANGYHLNYQDCSTFEILPCLAGMGTADNPYQISTPKQLDCMMDYLTENAGSGEHFRIMNDIDMESYLVENYMSTGWRGNEITQFDGYLHGGGHVISGIWMNHTMSDTVGGLLAGTTTNAAIDSLGIMFSSRGLYAKGAAGGLVGYNAGVINSCFATGGNIITLNDMYGTGGLVGVNNGNIQNSYTTCNVIAATSAHTGGLAGYNETNGVIMYTYAAGLVTGSYSGYVGGIVGYNNTGRVRSNFFDIQKTLQSKGIGYDVSGNEERFQFGYTTAEMKDEDEMYQLDFTNIWRLIPGYYPILQWQKAETAPYSLLLPNEFAEEIEDGLFHAVRIYPNPTTGIVTIEIAEEKPQITVYNSNGSLIIRTTEKTIDLSTYPNGMYLLNVDGQMNKIIKK